MGVPREGSGPPRDERRRAEEDARAEITFELVNRLDAELVEGGASTSRRRNVMIVLRSVLSAACDAGKLAEMPHLPKLPKVGETVLSVLSGHRTRSG